MIFRQSGYVFALSQQCRGCFCPLLEAYVWQHFMRVVLSVVFNHLSFRLDIDTVIVLWHKWPVYSVFWSYDSLRELSLLPGVYGQGCRHTYLPESNPRSFFVFLHAAFLSYRVYCGTVIAGCPVEFRKTRKAVAKGLYIHVSYKGIV